jgi:hypothetical protein
VSLLPAPQELATPAAEACWTAAGFALLVQCFVLYFPGGKIDSFSLQLSLFSLQSSPQVHFNLAPKVN